MARKRIRGSWQLACLLVSLSCCAGCGDSADGNGGGGSGGNGNGLSNAERACQLADADMVTSAFEGTADEGMPDIASNCRFELTGAEVDSVSVFYFGNATRWDGVRQGYDDNRGGTTDVSGLGDEAFYPNDVGPYSLVVQAEGIIFEVSVSVAFIPMPSAELADSVRELAEAIVARLGG
jgi:hypothetical protein